MSKAALAACVAISAAALRPDLALADYQLCNKTSYVLDAALGIETGGAMATQGWFQIAPGTCSIVLSGAWTGERYFLHTRTPDFYAEAPQARHISRMFCVKRRDFLIPGAEKCRDAEGVLASFSEFVPDRDIKMTTTDLTDDNQYGLERARTAGAQRLLALLGFDPGEINGEAGEKMQLAIADFLSTRQLPERHAELAALSDELLKAVQEQADRAGLKLCNATGHKLTAAVGATEDGRITTRGWFELAAGSCQKVLRQPLDGAPLYVFAEAVGAGNKPVGTNGAPLVWAGDTVLCAKDTSFEIAEHGDCAARALRAVGFRPIASGGAKGLSLTLDESNAGPAGAGRAP